MEFCDKGSLSRALAMFKLHEPVDSSTVNWDCWACLETLKEVVSALIFLHEHKILHGDLKAANVLLASDESDRRGWIAKVADFGLARVLKDKNHIKTQTFGTVTHMPPELLAKGTLSPSSDVYAVGVLMWELFTAEKVFKQLSDSEVILAVVTKKARPTFPSDCPSK
ncbi:protein kinase domain-containing protein [Haematococcus lacustris]|uniref:Protein kinase domain-containing protein n=1 Tax=Haematococcus lacustris TaxID=44745 RepID=A0A699YWP7_HAELA|nr:protein kinase domain-containing protein [Haematococcus lacustris]